MIRRPPRSTLSPPRRSPDLNDLATLAVFTRRVIDQEKTIPIKFGGEVNELSLRRRNDGQVLAEFQDRKSTRLNSSHGYISYAVFCLKKKNSPPYVNSRHHHT